MLERRWLLGVARHEREALGRVVQYTPPDRWEADSPCEGWRVKDVLGHLAASEVAAAEVLGGESPAELDEYRKSLEGEDFSVGAWNQWTVARRREASAVSVGLEWGRAADLLLARAGKTSDDDWHQREVAWVAGELRLKYLVQSRVAEWWLHGEDVREAGRLPPRREHWPIFAVNDLAVQLIPYSLSREGLALDDRSVRIELTGPGEGTWHQSTSIGALASDKKPDAFIDGLGYAFASVAGERADADFCLYEGVLNIGGDVELAETILRTLRPAP